MRRGGREETASEWQGRSRKNAEAMAVDGAAHLSNTIWSAVPDFLTLGWHHPREAYRWSLIEPLITQPNFVKDKSILDWSVVGLPLLWM